MSPLDAFLEAYWKDREAGSVQPLPQYLERFPGDDLAIAAEFVALETGKDQAATGLPSDGKDRFGPYRLLRSIGRGGQGEVFLAEDTRLRRKVALKLLTNLGPVSDALASRFRREAEVASRIQHPGICTVYEAGEVDGTLYIAMQYVEGDTLRDRITDANDRRRRGSIKLDVPETEPRDDDTTTRHDVVAVVRLFEGIARAAHAAHEHGIIHRDLKPANIMVQPDGNPVILDFGLAREIQDDRHALTVTGDFFGTPAYMAPEQLRDERHAPDPRTDNYAIGVTLYECLTLNRPFDGATRESLFHDILNTAAPNPRVRNPQIPSDLATVLTIALEKDPDHRYATAGSLADDLRLITERKPIRGRPVGSLLRLKRWTQRNPALALTLIGLTIALGIALWQLDAKNDALRVADEERERNLGFIVASHSRNITRTNPGLGLALAVEAHESSPSAATVSALYEALHHLRERASIPMPALTPVFAEFSPDATRFLTIAAEGETIVWDIASSREVRRFQKPHHFDPTGKLVLGEPDRTPRVNAQGIGENLAVSVGVEGLKWTGEQVTASDLGTQLLAAGTPSGRINVWNIKHPDRGSFELRGHEGAVRFLRFDARDRHLVSLSDDGTMRIWVVSTTRFGDVQVDPIDPGRDATSKSADGNVLAYQDRDGNAIIVNIETGVPERIGDKGPVFVSDDGAAAVVLRSGRRAATVWDLRAVEREPVSIDTEERITAVAASRARDLVVTGHQDGTVRAYRLSNGALRWRMRAHESLISAVALGPTGQFATASDDGTARIWRDEDGGEVAMLRGTPDARLWSLRYYAASARWLTAFDRTVRTWLSDGTASHTVSLSAPPEDAHLAPDGSTVGAALEAGGGLLAPAGGAQVDLESDGLSDLTAIGFDRSGRHFVTHDANAVQLYDAASGALTSSLPVANLVAAHLAIIDGTDYIVTLSFDGILRRWPIDVASIAKTQARDLTARERRRFGLRPRP